MNKLRIGIFLFSAALLAASASQASAATQVGRWGLGLYGGAVGRLGSEIVNDRSDAGSFLGLRGKYHVNKTCGWVVDLDEFAPGGELPAHILSLSGLYAPKPDWDWTPFVTAGVSAAVLEDMPESGHRYVNPGLKIGTGVDHFLTDDVSIGAVVNYHHVPKRFHSGAFQLDAIAWGIGGAYYFGGASQPVPSPVAAIEPAPEPVPDEDGDRVGDDFDLCPETPSGTSVDTNGCPPMESGAHLDIRLTVEFASGADVVRPQYRDAIGQFATFLSEYPNTVAVIEGHTDDRGNEAFNVDLSRRRAASVREYLISDFGIAEDRLSSEGFGPSRPIADNSDAGGRKRNRRVVASVTAH